MAKSKKMVPARLGSLILTLRDEKVILDADLAEVYGVSTKSLNQAAKRNSARFPADFRFRLTREERDDVVTNCDRLGRLKFSSALPWVFTEHGAIMAATVLGSPRAVEMSVFVVRAFIRLRELARSHVELAAKLAALERKVTGHDHNIREMFKAIRGLLEPPAKPRRQIGFGRKSGD